MLNLLRADFYKLKRSKSFYICLAAVAVFTVMVMLNITFSMADKKETLYINTLHWIYVPFNEPALLPTFMPIFQAIFITMFITAEFGTGTIKDAVCLGYSREKIFASKLITVFAGSIIMILLAIISTLIVAIAVLGIYGSASTNDLLQLLRMTSIESLLFMAFASVFVMIAFIVKNMGGTMSLSICTVLFLGFAVSGAKQGIWRFLWLLMNFSPVAEPNAESQAIKTAIIIGLSYLLICSAAGGILFKKQDIK